MALAILDGTQTATTLSTIVTSGQHIPAHTIVSLGTQAVTDISTAVGLLQSAVATQGSVANIAFVKIGGHTGTATTGNIVHVSSVGAMKVDASASTQPISGTVTANLANVVTTDSFWGTQAIKVTGGDGYGINITGVDSNSTPTIIQEGGGIPVYPRDNSSLNAPFPISGTVTIGAGTAQIGSVTASLSAGTAEIGTVKPAKTQSGVASFLAVDNATSKLFTSTELTAGTAQIGSVTASISGTVPVSISSVTIGNSVTIGSLPAISGTVTANIAISSSAITSGSFSSLTSATLVPANTARKMATVYNLGAGQLFVNAGATATTLGGGFMVALSSGDYFECGFTTTTLSAIFATAGTASWVSH